MTATQRLALPAGGRDEITPLWRNELQATQTAWKRADSHQSGARCVGRIYRTPTDLIDNEHQTHPAQFSIHSNRFHFEQNKKISNISTDIFQGIDYGSNMEINPQAMKIITACDTGSRIRPIA